MPDWPTLWTSALAWGLCLSLALSAVIVVSAVVAADVWLGDYPPDIREKFGPISPRAARLRPLVAVVFFLLVVVIPLLGLSRLRAGIEVIPFSRAFAFAALTLLVFNAFDLVVLDWIVFCAVQPPQVVLPGTEGMAGYRDYYFHFVGFLKGLAFCGVAGLFIAGVWTLLQGTVT